MADYGVTDSGFARKPLATIKSEIEADFRETFGSDIILSSQSPAGQIVGLFSDIASELWEVCEDIYQSYDPDQAEGVRLEALARLRLLARATGETDESLRQAITNASRARIDIEDMRRAITNLDGVTYCQIFVNDSDTVDDNGLEPHSVAAVVMGGDDEDIATALRAYVVPGIGTSGNARVDTSSDGICRTMWIGRPTEVPVTLSITVTRTYDNMGCPPVSLTTIAETLLSQLQGDRMPVNGEDVTEFLIRSAIESQYTNIEVESITGSIDGDATLPLGIGFYEIATFSLSNITVTNA